MATKEPKAVAALNDMQKKFVEEYCIDFNGKRAAIAAGYSKRTAAVQASQHLTKLNVQRAIAEKLKQASDRSMLSAIDVQNNLCRIASTNILDFYRIDEQGQPVLDLTGLTREQAYGIASLKVETYIDSGTERGVKSIDFRLDNRKGALDTLAKIKGLIAQGNKGDIQRDRPELDVNEEELVEEIILRRTRRAKRA